MQSNGYWNRVLTRRISRRRGVAATGGIALGSALLAACGGDEAGGRGNAGSTQDSSGLLAPHTDSTKDAKPGGSYTRAYGEPRSIDPATNNASTAQPHILPMYSLLTKEGFRNDGNPPGLEDIKGDAADKWEFSPDSLQITLHLRDNHKFDPRPPTNGRQVTSADVKYSAEKIEALSAFGADLFSSRGGGAPIESVSTPNDNTVVMKLAFPDVTVPRLLSFSRLFIAPVESEDKFNPKAEARGSGPFYLERWLPSEEVVYKKNPNWYEKGRPFLDTYTFKSINEYATNLAQFETGNLDFLDVNPQDLLRVKSDHPEMVMLQEFKTGGPNGHYWQFSQKPDSPFADARVRRAASMALDRDLYLDVIENLEPFKAAGLPIKKFWHSHMPAQGVSWLDPQGSELGEGAKYFKHDLAEAKKLLSAAGYDGRQLNFWSRSRTGTPDQFADVTVEMLKEIGLDLKHEVLDNNSTWRQQCQQYEPAGGAFDGFCYATQSAMDDVTHFLGIYTPEGKFRLSSDPIPGITDRVKKLRSDTDLKHQLETMKQLQRDIAKDMLNLPLPGLVLGYTLRWPWLKNNGVFTWGGGSIMFSSSRLFTEFWIDQALKPS